jgi:hypothetical protein
MKSQLVKNVVLCGLLGAIGALFGLLRDASVRGASAGAILLLAVGLVVIVILNRSGK